MTDLLSSALHLPAALPPLCWSGQKDIIITIVTMIAANDQGESGGRMTLVVRRAKVTADMVERYVGLGKDVELDVCSPPVCSSHLTSMLLGGGVCGLPRWKTRCVCVQGCHTPLPTHGLQWRPHHNCGKGLCVVGRAPTRHNLSEVWVCLASLHTARPNGGKGR